MTTAPDKTFVVTSPDDSEAPDSFIVFTGPIGGPTFPDSVVDRDTGDGTGLMLREAIHLANVDAEFDERCTAARRMASLLQGACNVSGDCQLATGACRLGSGPMERLRPQRQLLLAASGYSPKNSTLRGYARVSKSRHLVARNRHGHSPKEFWRLPN